MEEREFDRVLTTSDLHGQKDRFDELLKKAKYDSKKDLLIVCGDMIDRGTQNLATLYKCMELQAEGAIILLGNHEEFLMESLDELLYGKPNMYGSNGPTALDWWVGKNGGDTTYEELKSLSNEELERIYKWCAKLPAYAMVEDWIFVHAGVNSKKPIEQNSVQDFIWSREEFIWTSAYEDKIVVFGHTPTFYMNPYDFQASKDLSRTKIWHDRIHGDKIGIDCGGVFGGRLAMLEVPSLKEFYA